MKKYWQVLILFWTAAIAAQMEYRINFLIAAVSSIGGMFGSIFGLSLFYRNGYTFPGWSWEQAMVVIGIFTILEGFSSTFLVPNLNRIVTLVQEGTLDFVLLKPISSQFWLSARSISLWGLSDVLVGIALLGYATRKLEIQLGNYFLSLLPLIFGLTILYGLWFILGATSVWFVKIANVTEVLRGLLEAGKFPAIAYPVAYRFFFTFVIPVTFLTTIPAETLLGRGNMIWIGGSGVLAIFMLFASQLFWRFALRFYTSASS
jgi:ABC-2 type transport system permease protein